MALHPSKKLKISKGNRLFHVDWELEFFFVEDREKIICLICRDTVASNKRGNLERHYNTKHGKDVCISIHVMVKTISSSLSNFNMARDYNQKLESGSQSKKFEDPCLRAPLSTL